MCGIVARINAVHPGKEAQLRALNSMIGRGPDSSGEWQAKTGEVWLGHRRLSIVDLSENGSQPMHNEDGTIHLTCNGEIYNYSKLRLELEQRGHRFYSNSDSEVVLHSYEEWGTDCVQRFTGMFAFVVWDEKKRFMMAARDHVGIKPLYYASVDKGLVIASEIRAILPLLPVKPNIDITSVAYVMTLGYVPSPYSIWNGIKKLEPGHLLVWDENKGIVTNKYWEPPVELKESFVYDPAEWEDLYHKVLQDHLLADVPVGLFLSGGIDSSSVAAGLRQIKNSLHTLSLSFPESEKDEGPLAAFVANSLGFSHETVQLKSVEQDALIEKTVACFDEPYSYSAFLTMYAVCEGVAGRYKVMLSGDGGDEVFGGYNWYNNLGQPAQSFIHSWLRPVISHAGSLVSKDKIMDSFSRISAIHRHATRLHPRFLPEEAKSLLRPTGLQFDDQDMLRPLLKYYEPRLPLKRALQRIDLMTFCSDVVLPKVDRASMKHSIEVRVPLLDKRVIEWGLALPDHMENEKEPKWVLRDYLASKLPPQVLRHPKQGFSLPLLSGFDWGRAMAEIEGGFWVKNGYWDKSWKKLVKPDSAYWQSRVWNLYVLTRWARQWVL